MQQAQANLERDLAQFENARTQERRYSTLLQKELIAREQYDQLRTNMVALEATVQADRAAFENAKAALAAARATIENARAIIRADEAAVDSARLQLGYTIIRSPLDGRMGRAEVRVGSLVGSSDSTLLATVSTLDPMYVNFSVSEREALAVWRRRAGPAPAPPASRSRCRTTASIPRPGSSTSSIAPWTRARARSRCARPSRTRRACSSPGSTCAFASCSRSARDALLVPQAAVQESQGSASVFVVGADQTVQARTVKLGPRFETQWVVDEGVKPGEQVVVSGLQQIRAGMRVEPTREAAPPPPRDADAHVRQLLHRSARSSPRCSPSSSSSPARSRSPSCRSRMFPQITPPQVVVQATYPGASAEVVEQTVATPIEQQVNGVENMIYMSSRSGSDGTMTLTVTFKVGTNHDIAAVNVQNRVAIAEAQLPQDVVRQGISITKQSPDLVEIVALTSPDGSRDELYLSNYATLQVRDVLARVPGVGQVQVFNGRDYGMRLWLNPDTLASLGLTAGDVADAVREQNLQAAAGQIGQPPAPQGQQFQYTVTTRGRLSTPAEFEDIILRTRSDGSILRVRDVGRVELGAQSYGSFGRVGGKPAALVGIFQLPDANALDVSRGVQAAMARLAPELPERRRRTRGPTTRRSSSASRSRRSSRRCSSPSGS